MKRLAHKTIFSVHNIDHKMSDHVCLCVSRETANIPLIALGLKETKDVDFSTFFKVHKQQLQIYEYKSLKFRFFHVT